MKFYESHKDRLKGKKLYTALARKLGLCGVFGIIISLMSPSD
ncbi:hypothetical protein J5U21_02013 [Saccharolobus shibatae]|uniref:Uncharacterized protein n=1 Tax=Saccharolobus shibatae TaxID=2286 RepID=A0A8F5BVQ0_9CREN|nr:hypothetical protein J5U21_02013 [Saccharolobus shibatae]